MAEHGIQRSKLPNQSSVGRRSSTSSARFSRVSSELVRFAELAKARLAASDSASESGASTHAAVPGGGKGLGQVSSRSPNAGCIQEERFPALTPPARCRATRFPPPVAVPRDNLRGPSRDSPVHAGGRSQLSHSAVPSCPLSPVSFAAASPAGSDSDFGPGCDEEGLVSTEPMPHCSGKLVYSTGDVSVGTDEDSAQLHFQSQREGQSRSRSHAQEALKISGVMGPCADVVNGYYRSTEMTYNGRPAWEKQGDASKWLLFMRNGHWYVCSAERKSSGSPGGWCRSVDKGLDHPADATTHASGWQTCQGAGTWVPQPSVTVMIFSGSPRLQPIDDAQRSSAGVDAGIQASFQDCDPADDEVASTCTSCSWAHSTPVCTGRQPVLSSEDGAAGLSSRSSVVEDLTAMVASLHTEVSELRNLLSEGVLPSGPAGPLAAAGRPLFRRRKGLRKRSARSRRAATSEPSEREQMYNPCREEDTPPPASLRPPATPCDERHTSPPSPPHVEQDTPRPSSSSVERERPKDPANDRVSEPRRDPSSGSGEAAGRNAAWLRRRGSCSGSEERRRQDQELYWNALRRDEKRRWSRASAFGKGTSRSCSSSVLADSVQDELDLASPAAELPMPEAPSEEDASLGEEDDRCDIAGAGPELAQILQQRRRQMEALAVTPVTLGTTWVQVDKIHGIPEDGRYVLQARWRGQQRSVRTEEKQTTASTSASSPGIRRPCVVVRSQLRMDDVPGETEVVIGVHRRARAGGDREAEALLGECVLDAGHLTGSPQVASLSDAYGRSSGATVRVRLVRLSEQPAVRPIPQRAIRPCEEGSPHEDEDASCDTEASCDLRL